MFSVLAFCDLNGMCNLYSAGSLDLILEFCNDYWTGSQINEFTKAQKYDEFMTFAIL